MFECILALSAVRNLNLIFYIDSNHKIALYIHKIGIVNFSKDSFTEENFINSPYFNIFLNNVRWLNKNVNNSYLKNDTGFNISDKILLFSKCKTKNFRKFVLNYTKDYLDLEFINIIYQNNKDYLDYYDLMNSVLCSGNHRVFYMLHNEIMENYPIVVNQDGDFEDSSPEANDCLYPGFSIPKTFSLSGFILITNYIVNSNLRLPKYVCPSDKYVQFEYFIALRSNNNSFIKDICLSISTFDYAIKNFPDSIFSLCSYKNFTKLRVEQWTKIYDKLLADKNLETIAFKNCLINKVHYLKYKEYCKCTLEYGIHR